MLAPLVVVSGPSGVGKSTLVARLAAVDPRVQVSVSATTRPRRDGERDGVHYRFLDDAAFDRLVAADAFLEHATVHGNRYGTLRADVEALRDADKIVVLEIDVQGARSVRASDAGAILVFILPPDDDALQVRLAGRGSDDPATIALRLRNAEAEVADAAWFDERVVNADLEATVSSLRGIIDRIVGSSATPPSSQDPA